MDGRAHHSHRSRAISAPELPKPTTSTDLLAKLRPLWYRELCMLLPVNVLLPGMFGGCLGSETWPVHMTRARAWYDKVSLPAADS